jgi:hypothetical protein
MLSFDLLPHGEVQSYANGPWVNGVLASQLWSFAGPSNRAPEDGRGIDFICS